MTTRSLICPSWEIRAFLAGNKTQIRRPVKPQPPEDVKLCGPRDFPCFVDWRQTGPVRDPIPCPFGGPGDQLIVKETWRGGRLLKDAPAYREKVERGIVTNVSLGPWYSGATMPARYSRITLEVVKVLAPQRGKITEEDAKAEGAERLGPEWPCIGNPSYYRGFRKHWDATFGNRFPWDAAWCWAARVRVVKPS